MTSNFLISIPLASINQFCVEMNLNVDAVKKFINPNYFQIVDVPCKTSLYCFAALVSSFTGEKPMTLVLALVAFLMQKTFGYMWMFANCFCADGLYFKKELTPIQTLVQTRLLEYLLCLLEALNDDYCKMKRLCVLKELGHVSELYRNMFKADILKID